MRSVAFVLLLCGAAHAETKLDPAERARGLVKPCETVRMSHGVGFRCPGLLVQLSEVQAPSEDAAVQDQLANLRASFKLEAAPTPMTFEIAGQQRPGARLTVAKDAPEAGGTRALVSAYMPDPRGTCTVTCMMPDPSVSLENRCRAMIDGLCTVGPAFFESSLPAQELLTPSFLGKDVALPKGCNVRVATPDGFDVECEGHVAVRYVKQASAEQAARAAAFLRQQMLGQPGSAAGASAKCAIGGVASTCETVTSPGTVTVMGTALVKGQAVVVSCSRDAAKKGVPKACAPLVKF